MGMTYGVIPKTATVDPAGALTNGANGLDVKALGIDASRLAANAVTTTKVQDAALTYAKLATDAAGFKVLDKMAPSGVSSVTSVTFTTPSILVIFYDLSLNNVSAGDNIYLRFNGDSTAGHYAQGKKLTTNATASNVIANSGFTDRVLLNEYLSGTPSSRVSGMIVCNGNPTASRIGVSGTIAVGNNTSSMFAPGEWTSAAAITSVTMGCGNGNITGTVQVLGVI